MWDYDGLIGKCGTYFRRAQEVAAEDDAFAVWLLLGLEFLLRAPLAQVHPSLLADPTGDAIMHACGYPSTAETKEPKSIQIKTVISRLGRIVEPFTSDREADATSLTTLRNRELHSSEAALASIDTSLWLPRFTRVADVLCQHLGLETADLVGRDIVEHGRALVDAEDRRLSHEVTQRITAAVAFAQGLKEAEREHRFEQGALSRMMADATVPCPACGHAMPVELEDVRTTNERLDGDDILRDIISIARRCQCVVCGLRLESTAEVKAAGIQQEFTRTETESVEERYMSGYADDDYGND